MTARWTPIQQWARGLWTDREVRTAYAALDTRDLKLLADAAVAELDMTEAARKEMERFTRLIDWSMVEPL